jgi:LacI family transcriptional regulator
MSSQSKRNFSVAVFLNRKSKGSRDQAAGVFRFASEHDDWVIHLYSRPETEADLKRLASSMITRPDGIISGGMRVVEALRRRFRRRIPAILIDVNDPALRANAGGLVLCDDHAAAERAAKFFLSRGYESFAFAGLSDTPTGDPDMFNSENRETGFRRRVEKSGKTFSSYHEKLPPGGCHYIDGEALGSWLRALPKPCALLACSDTLAQSVLDECRKRRIGVPQQIAVLGIDNEPSVCENTKPSLSSIEPDFFGGGYRAAEILDEIMRRKPSQASIRRVTYGLVGLSERMSTRNTTGLRLRTARALETIRNRALAGLTAKQLADEMGLTTRSLELAFRSASQGTVRDAILNVRLAEAERLVKHTRLCSDEIAKRCGFRTGSALKAIFKKRFGASIRAWRKSANT